MNFDLLRKVRKILIPVALLGGAIACGFATHDAIQKQNESDAAFALNPQAIAPPKNNAGISILRPFLNKSKFI